MTDKQENFISMSVSVKTVCDANSGVWSGTPGFVTAYSTFNTQLAAVQALGTAQEQSIKGFTTGKGVNKTDMIAKTLVLIAGIKAYALSSGNTVLFEEVNYSETVLKQTRDENIASRCQIVQDRAVINSVALAGFNITPVMITEHQTSIGVYSASSQLPSTKEDEQQVFTEGIATTIKQIIETFKILDNIAKTFTGVNEAFKTLYFNARETYDLGGGGPKKPAGG